MTERVTRDPELLAAWPQRGVCWKVVRPHYDGLGPLHQRHFGHKYDSQEWQRHVALAGWMFPLWGFHCFAAREDALAYLATECWFDESIVEVDYDGLVGIGHHVILGREAPAVVLLCDRIRPRSWVTLPGCEVAQPAEMAEAVA